MGKQSIREFLRSWVPFWRHNRARHVPPAALEAAQAQEFISKLSILNQRLNDLLFARKGGIIDLLDEYGENPTPENWEKVKSRGKANYDKLQAVYGMLQDLEWVPFFGERPDIPNTIIQVIDEKKWGLYRHLESHPDPPKKTEIPKLKESARSLNGKVEYVQKEIAEILRETKRRRRELLQLLSKEPTEIGIPDPGRAQYPRTEAEQGLEKTFGVFFSYNSEDENEVSKV
jgi:hypothetical protein